MNYFRLFENNHLTKVIYSDRMIYRDREWFPIEKVIFEKIEKGEYIRLYI